MKKIGLLILAILVSIWMAFVFTRLWGWFIVPLGVVSISLFHAYGILYLVKMFSLGRLADRSNEDFDDYAEFKRLCKGAFFVLMIWGTGYVAYLLK